ncbi:histone acetyltransferase 1 [Haplosporangium sp. Z 767]|nr:histone acetyltransferase 1 [Haplosporangium sp. Z 767]
MKKRAWSPFLFFYIFTSSTHTHQEQQLEMNALKQWVTNSSEAVNIRLVRAAPGNGDEEEDDDIIEFNPAFTYPIFGEQEQIYGYKDLAINLEFASGSLASCFSMGYKDKKPDADKIYAKMKDFLPGDIIDNHDLFLQITQRDNKEFKPMGNKVAEYRINHEGYENSAKFDTPRFLEYHRRMQCFAIFFIEGASFIEDTDEKWEARLLFERVTENGEQSYNFVGYCNMYPYFYYPDQIRMRISQFLILPPYQQQGHGNRLYQSLYNDFCSRKEIREMTVEDPNEEFSDLRDKNDMRHLTDMGVFKGVQAPIKNDRIEQVAKTYKLTKRQVARCFELALLKNLDKRNKAQYKAFRLQVKERLFKHNAEALNTLDKSERIEKLHETFLSVEEDYHRLLVKQHMTLSAFGFSAAPSRAPLAPETSSRVLFAGWASFVVENAKGEFEICGVYGQEESDLIAHAKESVDQASSGLVKFYGWESLQGYMSASGDVVGLSRSTSSSTYQPNVLYRNARDVAACGRSKDHLTVVIDKESGKLFQWTAADPVVKPMLAYTTTSSSLVLENVKFDKIWAGEGHLLALAVDGTLYSWGSGRHGQLGHGDLASEPVPKPIESLQGMRIVDAACGGSFTVALSGRYHIF